MVLENVPAEVYTVLLPIAGVGVVAVTILVFFWLGSGRQRSYDDAVMAAKNKADKLLRDKEHQSPRASKKKRVFPRKPKKADAWEEASEETGAPAPSTTTQQPVKSILKPVVNTVTPPPPPPAAERSPRNRVEFHLQPLAPKADEPNKTPRSPPTPHPSKTTSFQSVSVVTHSSPPPPMPSLSEAVDEEEAATQTVEPSKPVVAVEETKKKATRPSGGAGGGGQKKNRTKSKHTTQESLDGVEALPISRLADIVSASSMSDEDIQVLLELLFDKLGTNAEWEDASLRSESAKTLKKHNTELQKRYEEAQRTVLAHSSKVKDLRSEIQMEKSRHTSAENNLQGKISQQVNELQICKTKVSGLEQELKQVKATQSTQQLQEENLKLKEQLAAVSQQSSAQSSQLSVQGQQLLELQESVVAVKRELQRAEEVARSADAAAASASRVSELETLLAASEGEKEQLQGTMQSINEQKARAVVELDLLAATRTERDQLQARTDDLTGRLQDAESTLVGLREELQREASKVDTAIDERAKALEDQNASLQSDVEQIQQRLKEAEEQADSTKQAEIAALSERLSQEATTVQEKYEAEIAALKDNVTVLEQRDQQLKCDIEKLQAATSNGPPRENGEASTPALEEGEEGEEAGGGAKAGGSDKEVGLLKAEVEELTAEKKTLQQRLEELKTKNNSLRESCWKARDEAATKEKAGEQKLKQVYHEAEQRCKAAKEEALRDATENHKAFLEQLFPEVEVKAGDGVSGGLVPWLDAFEYQARQLLEGYKTEVADLKAKVLELQGSEHAAIEGVEQLQSTLKETMNFLGQLQCKVDDQTATNRQTVAEKDEMIERERFSNRALQEQLLQEKKESERLSQELESAVAECGQRVEELEGRLTQEEVHRQLAENEVETLRHSLHHELEIKEDTQEKMEELNEKEEEMEGQMKEEDHRITELSEKNQELVQEVELMQGKLVETEKRLETMKLSNRDLNTKLSEMLPSPATSSDV